VDRLPEDPYPAAQVVLLDESSESDAELLGEVATSLRRYLAVSAEAGQGGDVMFELSADPTAASYQVASILRLVAPERQELLELPSTQDRLRRESMLIRRETELLERTMMGG